MRGFHRLNRGGNTGEGGETFADDLQQVDLVDILLEALDEVRIEGEGDVALDLGVVDELEDGDGELVPQSTWLVAYFLE
jgi:hypothetical protein